MLILVPGQKTVSSYIVACSFREEAVTIFTELHEYTHSDRLLRRLLKEKRDAKIVECSPYNAHRHLKGIENPIIHFNQLSPLAACVLQSVKGEYHLIAIDDEGKIHNALGGATAFVRPPQISLEALLDLRGIKGEFSIEAKNADTAMALASEYDSEEKAIDLLRWINGKQPSPPFEALKGISIPENRPWLRRGWLTEYVFATLKAEHVERVYHSVRFADGETSIDVALIQDHRLVAFACEPRPYVDECIARALAVHEAAKRLAGDFAQTILICGAKFPEDISDRLADIVGRYEIEVIGLRSIPRLRNDILPIKTEAIPDTEVVREKRRVDSFYGRHERPDHW